MEPLTAAQAELVSSNYNLTFFYLHRHGYSVDEYSGVAAFGLCKAAKTFDPSKGCTFSTWALNVIHFTMLQERRRESRRIENNAEVFSLDSPTCEEGEGTLSDVIPAGPTDFSGAELDEFRLTLDPMESAVLTGTLEGRKQRDIAADLNSNQVAVSRTLQRVRDKYINFIGGKFHE